MIRFILRLALLLGLIAFFLPGGKNGTEGTGINYFLAFAGFQELMADIGGFCDRSPAACGAGHQIAAFVANRIGDGLEYGYRLATGGETPHEKPETAPLPPAPAAPTQTVPPTANQSLSPAPAAQAVPAVPRPSPRPLANPS